MRRIIFCLVGLALSYAGPAGAESYVSATGSYYKERSTRVMIPTLNARLELPHEIRVEGGFLVDQITSASGAFTVTDEPFTEYRVEASASVDKVFDKWLQPGLSIKYSRESDYQSLLVGGRVAALFDDRLSTLSAGVQYQTDVVKQRGREGFRDELDTVYLNLDYARTLGPRFVMGGVASAQVMRGFMENVYRVEQHPRAREDFSLGVYARYRPHKTGLIWRLCGHYSTWKHVAVSLEFEVWQTVTRWLDVTLHIRQYHQTGVFFTDRAEIEDPDDPDGAPIAVSTTDPTLFGHRTVRIGGSMIFSVPGARGLRIEPGYYFLYQSTRYGNAHMASLAFYWPFSI